MAESLPAKLWLPNEESLSTSKTVSSLLFPTEFPYEFDPFESLSDPNSTVDSVVSSTDSTDGSDDDDFFAGLTHHLARSSLIDTVKSAASCVNPDKIEKKWVKASSPRSTLSEIDSCFFANSSFKLQSPPTMFLSAGNDTRSFIHAAEREAARLKMSGERIPNQTNVTFNPGLIGGRPPIPDKSTKNRDYGLFTNQPCPRNPTFSAQTQQTRRDLVLQTLCASSWATNAKAGWLAEQYQKQEFLKGGRSVAYGNVRSDSSMGLYQSPWLPSAAQHPIQTRQQNVPTVRSVNVGGCGIKRASSGTGVFLPRRYINPSECHQKPGNPSTRPSEKIRSPIQAPFHGCSVPAFDATISRRNPLLPLPRNLMPEAAAAAAAAAMNHELHLPQEWTY